MVFHLDPRPRTCRTETQVSALVVHRVGEAEPQRVRLEAGEAVALRGRGTIHSWEPMGPDEERTLLAIGFQRADDR